MKNMKIIDLFCGCGGLSKGFENAGFDIVFAIDFWKDAIQTYNKNHIGKVAHCQDIHELREDELIGLKRGGVLGVIGGPPCQGYSTVGTRDINDPRNHLYLEYCRVIETIQPEFFVLENVKGLITLDGGAFKNDIVDRFSKLGYNVSYKIINAADCGVPQNRERVFFVGVRHGFFSFPETHCRTVTCAEALGDLPPLDENNGDAVVYNYICAPQNDYQVKMRCKSIGVFNHQITKHTEQTKSIIALIPDGGKIKDLPRQYWDVRKYNKAFERMGSNRPSNTVDTGHRNYFHYVENRIPTARENCRLQSFPDDFIILGSRTSQYKQVGNAVPPLMAQYIAEAIKNHLEATHED